MKKLQNLVESRPDLKSDRADFLKLAVKDEGGAVRGTGPHQVKLVGCENAVNKDFKTQKEVKGVNLLFEESGSPKKYFVPILGDDGKFHYLIELFSTIDEGTELIMEYKRRENSFKGFIDVRRAGETEAEPVIDIGIDGGESGEDNKSEKVGENDTYHGTPVFEEDDDEVLKGLNF